MATGVLFGSTNVKTTSQIPERTQARDCLLTLLRLLVQLPRRAGPDQYATEDDYRDWSDAEEDGLEGDEEGQVCILAARLVVAVL